MQARPPLSTFSLFLFILASQCQSRYVHERLLGGKTLFTETSLDRFLANLRTLNNLQAKILKIPEQANDDPTTFEQQLSEKPRRPDQLPYLFEGDIILTDHQMEEIIRNAENELREKTGEFSAHRDRRTMTSQLSLRWTSFPIPYYINTGTGVSTSAVQAGIARWQQETCITFTQLAQPPSGRNSYLEFIRGDGCYSYIGRVNSGGQQVSIGTGCTSLGTVTHEIGHALGFYHEQARYDRDDYVRIVTQNIESGYLSQFTKQSPSSQVDYGVAYDYGSVMHYDEASFTSNGGNTIQTLDGNYQYTIGQRLAPSFFDVKKINFAYCNSSCSTELPCQNSGYTDPNACSQCRCPDGLSGTFCTSAAPTSTTCGLTNIQAISDLRSISRSGSGACNYLIQAPAGKRIWWQIAAFNFPAQVPCQSTYIEVKYRADLGNTGARLCVNYPTAGSLAEGNSLLVIYKGSSSSRFAINFRYESSSDTSRKPWPATVKTTTAKFRSTTKKGKNPKNGKKHDDSNESSEEDPQDDPNETTTTQATTMTTSAPVPTTISTTTTTTTTTTQSPITTTDNGGPWWTTTRRTWPTGRTTTRRPPTTTDGNPGCTQWTLCSADCGGCGTQSRICRGQVQQQYCNIQPCRGGYCCRPYYYVVQGFCLRPLSETDQLKPLGEQLHVFKVKGIPDDVKIPKVGAQFAPKARPGSTDGFAQLLHSEIPQEERVWSSGESSGLEGTQEEIVEEASGHDIPASA